MLDCIVDGILDTLRLIPYLFVTFLLLELIEHKLNHKNEELLSKGKKVGPMIGGLLGAIPQCGFSTMASNLFSNKVITIGTLIAVFLSTSDEMLPIMISEHTSISILLKIVAFKVVVGIGIGFLVDFFYHKKENSSNQKIHDMCEEEHCHCKEEGILKSSLQHTLKIGFFILVVNILLNILLMKIGEDNLSKLLLNKNIITYFMASIIGLIPNCASSVIMTELYLQGLITIGTLLAGLLTGSGLGILVLWKTNKNQKENIAILSIIYFVGVVVGILVDIIL